MKQYLIFIIFLTLLNINLNAQEVYRKYLFFMSIKSQTKNTASNKKFTLKAYIKEDNKIIYSEILNIMTDTNCIALLTLKNIPEIKCDLHKYVLFIKPVPRKQYNVNYIFNADSTMYFLKDDRIYEKIINPQKYNCIEIGLTE